MATKQRELSICVLPDVPPVSEPVKLPETPLCDSCEEEPATVQASLCDMQGVVIEQTKRCRSCMNRAEVYVIGQNWRIS